MASIRERGGRWQVQIRRQGVNASGTFDTKTAAQRWARRIESEIDEGRSASAPRSAGTVADLLDRYEVAARAIRPLGRSKLHVLSQLRDGLGKVLVRSLTTDKILAHARKRRNAGAGPVTVALDLGLLGTVLRSSYGLLGVRLSDTAVREAHQALRGAGLAGKSHERNRRPTQDEIDRLCAHFRNIQRQVVPMADLIQFAIGTAMRREEITRLEWADLDVDRRVVLIRDRKDPRRKEGNHELVPLLPVTGYDPLEIIARQTRSERFIFPYRAETISTIHARACGRDGVQIDDLRFHDYRHEGVSRMFEHGMSIEEVALCSGHKDWRTLRRYTHLRPTDLARRYSPPKSPATPQNASDGAKPDFPS